MGVTNVVIFESANTKDLQDKINDWLDEYSIDSEIKDIKITDGCDCFTAMIIYKI